jgi:hypothetical protein
MREVRKKTGLDPIVDRVWALCKKREKGRERQKRKRV